MKKATITVNFDDEKTSALQLYLWQKKTTVEEEWLDEYLGIAQEQTEQDGIYDKSHDGLERVQGEIVPVVAEQRPK